MYFYLVNPWSLVGVYLEYCGERVDSVCDAYLAHLGLPFVCTMLFCVTFKYKKNPQLFGASIHQCLFVFRSREISFLEDVGVTLGQNVSLVDMEILCL